MTTKKDVLKIIDDYYCDTKRPIAVCLDELEEILEFVQNKVDCLREEVE